MSARAYTLAELRELLPPKDADRILGRLAVATLRDSVRLSPEAIDAASELLSGGDFAGLTTRPRDLVLEALLSWLVDVDSTQHYDALTSWLRKCREARIATTLSLIGGPS